MILTPLIGLVLAFLAPSAFSQDIQFDAQHNATSIIGTWSSGSKAVVTGAVSFLVVVFLQRNL